MPETVGGGGGFLDYDGDGWPDILLINGREWPGHETLPVQPTLALYRNIGDGHFKDVTAAAGLDFPLYGMGGSFADFDGDGDIDIYLTALGDNVLLRNDGGRFTNVTQTMGVDGNDPEPGAPPAWSTGSVWSDVDRDGYLDLFVCNYVRWSPETDLFRTLDGETKAYAIPDVYEGSSCRLYKNENGTRFRDVTDAAGVLNPSAKALSIAISDFNDDGWPDFVVANDTERNFLYLNNGDGTFTDIAIRSGVAYDENGRTRAGMGIDVADLNGDNRFSVAIGNFSREPVSMFTQIQDNVFVDRAGALGIAGPTLVSLTFGLRFADLDLDGLLDLVLANGHIEPEINSVQRDITFAQSPQILRNLGGGRFADISAMVGDSFTEPLVGRALATADIDRDGDLDILIVANGGKPRLLRNDLPSASANRIAVSLLGTGANRQGLGAHVSIYSAGFVQHRMLNTGSSYLSQSDVSEIIFGLGSQQVVDSLVVVWPTSGLTSRFGPLEAGTRYLVTEGTPATITAQWSYE